MTDPGSWKSQVLVLSKYDSCSFQEVMAFKVKAKTMEQQVLLHISVAVTYNRK